jgi:hypothetical protein
VKASTMTRKLHERQVSEMLGQLGVDEDEFSAQGIVTLLDAITSKMILDRLVGIKAGHKELIAMLHRIWGEIEQRLQPEAAR